MKYIYSGIAIFGGMGSGKNTYTDFIIQELNKNNINCSSYNIGDLCREIMKIGHINEHWSNHTRQLGQSAASKLREIDVNILNEYTLYRVFSDIETLHSDFSYPKNKENIKKSLLAYNTSLFPIIIGGRTEDDFNYWKSLGFLTVGITSNNSKKFLQERDSGQVQGSKEMLHPTEINTHYIATQLCDIHIPNDKSLEDFQVASLSSLKEFKIIK